MANPKYYIDEFKNLDGKKRYSIMERREVPKNLEGIVTAHYVTIATYSYKKAAEKKLQKLQK